MNNKQLVAAVAAASGCTKEDAGRMLQDVAALMADHFAKGDSVNLPGLGILEVRKKMERIIVNPGTGKRMLIPPKLVLAFKPHLSMKEKISKSED